MENKKPGSGAAVTPLYLILALLEYGAIIVLKAVGVLAWSWLAVLSSIIWAPPAIAAVALLILTPYALIRSAIKKRRHTK